MSSIAQLVPRPSLHGRLQILYRWWRKLITITYYRSVFGSLGAHSIIFKPMLITNPELIHIGDGVTIRDGVRLEALVIDPSSPPSIRIGNNVNIEQDVHIVALGHVRIHDNVSITARSALMCGTHPFFDVHNPTKIGARYLGKNSIVEIGPGCFLGIGSAIQMNVRLGSGVIVGTNSVVKASVPDFCVVEGNPAKIVMRYDPQQDRWSAADR